MKYRVLQRGDDFAIKIKKCFRWHWETDRDGFVKRFESEYKAIEFVVNKYKPLEHDRWIQIFEADL